MPYETEWKTAVTAVRRAVEMCRAVQKTLPENAYTKADRSPVTVADFAAQAVVCETIHETFSKDVVVAEEESGMLQKHPDILEQVTRIVSTSRPFVTPEAVVNAVGAAHGEGKGAERFWVLDPIDGTKGFLRGDQYCVALALVDAGEVVLGVLGCPRLGADGFLPAPQQGDEPAVGALLYAVKGAGAYRVPLTGGEETRLSTDAVRDAEKAVLCESVESAHADHDIHKKIAEAAGIQRPSLRVDSQVKYAAVASGLASAYLRIPKDSGYREKIWDHAAGAVVVTEAGGRVTDLTGKPLDFTRGQTLAENPGILVTGGPVHETLLAAVKAVLFSVA